VNWAVMVAAGVMEIGVEGVLVGVAPEVKDRLAVYFAEVVSGLARSEQRRNAELYARGLIEAGARKSLEPMVARLGGGRCSTRRCSTSWLTVLGTAGSSRERSPSACVR
jgi:hypothetical protein